MKKKDRIYAFACSDQHVKVHSGVLREQIILAGSRSKVESKKHVVYKGAEIMAALGHLQRGVTSEVFRKAHEVKRIFDGRVLYHEVEEKLHLYSKRAEVSKERREHPSAKRQSWADRVRAQPQRRQSIAPALPSAPRNPDTDKKTSPPSDNRPAKGNRRSAS